MAAAAAGGALVGMDGQAPMVVRDAVVDNDNDPLALTLGSIYAAAPTPPPRPPRPSPPPPSPPTRATRRRLNNSTPSQRRRSSSEPRSDDSAPSQRRRSSEPQPDNNFLSLADGNGTPPPPFPWATTQPARHDTLESLLRRGITTVEGEARCKRCSRKATVAFDLEAKFREVREFIAANRHSFDDRAPEAWMASVLPDCVACGQSRCLWPAIPADKGQINWLFLLLGQMLGCCTLEQLKYFCKNTGRHRTGAKNRVLYYAYLEMCKQLEPQGPFDDTVPVGIGFLHT
ncbi:uncharacterized protein [Lolium perenne]|uniref:uncharacterized protein n=1 Tax=Lolium perenne TaxID=4522 RepID=UPI0021F5E02B|nr:uncharacterized protein LOC127338541 [Lolium perenne]